MATPLSTVYVSLRLRHAVPVIPSDQLDKDGDAVDQSGGRVRSISVQHKAHELTDNDLALEFLNQHIRSDGRLLRVRGLRDGDDVQQYL